MPAYESAGNPTSPPRFGTSCHITPLAVLMSFGLRMTKLATYCGVPETRSMSVMIVLCGSFGSSVPKARPVNCS